MRRPNPPTPLKLQLQSKPQAQKPKFSQRSGRQDFTLEGMPVRHLPNRTRRTQGIALVIVLLSAMILMVSLLAISATMTISSQRTTVDQAATLQAQYAAESGITYAQLRFTEAQALFPLLAFDRTVGRASIDAAINDYCGASRPASKPDFPQGTKSKKYCPVSGDTITNPGTRNFTLFASYINDLSKADPNDVPYLKAYPTSSLSARTTYWRDMFDPDTLRPSVATAAPPGTSASYRVKYGFRTTRVNMINMGYRIFFKPEPVEAIGTVSANGTVIATRTLRADVTVPEFSIDVSRDSFSNYNYFVNRRLLPNALGGGKLNFIENETFEGRVHVNSSGQYTGAAWFSANSPNGGARFRGGFTTAASQLYWSSGTTVTEDKLFPGGYKFNADVIDLPENASSQRRAVVGDDSDDISPMTDAQLAAKYGKTASTFSNGVYYGKGTQAGTSWQKGTPDRGGGIYVRGNVDDLKLSTVGSGASSKQAINIKQTNLVSGKTQVVNTTFTQTSDTAWTVRVATTASNNTTTVTNTTISSGSFNGLVFVDGNVGNSSSQLDVADNPAYAEGLGGDGTDAPDVAAKTQLTVAASGDIFVKRDLTYTDDPRFKKDDLSTPDVDEGAVNVLGIYSEGGNVKVDGPANQSIKVHASIMAVGKERDPLSTVDGNGFGTIDYKRDRQEGAGISPKIELLGGIIEEQSQGVGQTGSQQVRKCGYYGWQYYCWYETVSTKGGYNRAFDWDTRYDTGFTPPYFPTQLKFTRKCQVGDPAITAKPVACSRNTFTTWTIQSASN